MTLTFRNSAFWKSCPNFVPRRLHIPSHGLELIGYFPYHTAKIHPEEIAHGVYASLLPLPRSLFKSLERVLLLHGIIDNKTVYIFESDDTPENALHKFKFALMIKDHFCLIADWGNVVNWDNKPINCKD